MKTEFFHGHNDVEYDVLYSHAQGSKLITGIFQFFLCSSSSNNARCAVVAFTRIGLKRWAQAVFRRALGPCEPPKFYLHPGKLSNTQPKYIYPWGGYGHRKEEHLFHGNTREWRGCRCIHTLILIFVNTYATPTYPFETFSLPHISEYKRVFSFARQLRGLQSSYVIICPSNRGIGLQYGIRCWASDNTS